MPAFDGFSWCCCDPCETHTAGFASDHDAGTITPTGLSDWPLDSGEAEFDGAGAPLVYTVPVEAKSSPLVVSIVVKAVNASTAGITVYVVIDGVTVSISVDAATDEVTLSYGSVSTVIGEWAADGEDLGLILTATECLTVIRPVNGVAGTAVKTALVEFDPLATSYLMGVVGNAGPCEGGESDCCPGQCRADPLEIDQHVALSMGGVTANVVGSLPWSEANSRWQGTVTRDYNGGTPTNFTVWITEDDCEASPPVYRLWINGADSGTSIDSSCSPFTITFPGTPFIDFPVSGSPDTEFTGTIPSGSGGTRIDDVRLLACGEVPERDCSVQTLCAECPELPGELSLVVPPFGTLIGHPDCVGDEHPGVYDLAYVGVGSFDGHAAARWETEGVWGRVDLDGDCEDCHYLFNGVQRNSAVRWRFWAATDGSCEVRIDTLWCYDNFNFSGIYSYYPKAGVFNCSGETVFSTSPFSDDGHEITLSIPGP